MKILKRQPRSRAILPAIKRLIVLRSTQNNLDRRELAKELIDEIKVTYPKEIAPTEATLIRMISHIRNREINPLEEPWHLGTLSSYPLPAEAIPCILKVQALPKLGARGLTIRQARRIASLYTIIEDIELLDEISWHYALIEKICQTTGTEFDTTQLDKELLKHKDEIIGYFRDDLIAVDWELKCQAFRELTGYRLEGTIYPTREGETV